jgi:DNA modification methylase
MIDKPDNDLWGKPIAPPSRGPLADRFLMPPFSVLNAREGDWQERKRAWIALGIESEVGRAGALMMSNQSGLLAIQRGTEKTDAAADDSALASGTSIFDPVLCELAYRWFCPHGGQVLDPFCGGSVRGVVAAHMERRYWGCDLRQEQVDANYAQAKKCCAGERLQPQWVCGDARNELAQLADHAPFGCDFVFSCPPYFDLEVYSDLPTDLSNMTWSHFCAAYYDIVQLAGMRLKNNRFACFVVGDVRDKDGAYRNLPGVTIAAFLRAGFALHNEAILVTSVGTLPIRAEAAFKAARKLGKTHQNMLVFVKGSAERAAAQIAMCEPKPK